tara:strand:- start:1107 stop:3146 length:2040 start_codon:yes stop_codon:yes gene_type:complete
MNKALTILFVFNIFLSYSQITVVRSAPYNDPNYLVDNLLLGGGIVASSHTFEGDSSQIGFFNAINTNLGIDSGIVMATGGIENLVPGNINFAAIPNTVTDPDLLNVANSVPGLIGQSFSVSSVNDIAKLEFDFVPTSDTITFRYVFGSQEYFAYENTQYNDVFGFFLSGPGISGPYANGAINLAIVPNSNPPLPITISSVNSVTPINQQYFIDNSGGLDTIADADGMTTVLTATAVVQCGETYHIKLAIADGTDSGLSSYVWLEAGSFKSPILDVTNDLGFDSTFIEIPCNSSVMLTADGGQGASYEWHNETGLVISSDPSVIVGPGKYVVISTSFGCSITSDTIEVVGDVPPNFDLGPDLMIPCNTLHTLNPVVTGGTGIYQYSWNNGSNDTSIFVSEGFYKLVVDDGTGCLAEDSITIREENPPLTMVGGGGDICEDGSVVLIDFTFNGLHFPWELTYSNGTDQFTQSGIYNPVYTITTSQPGSYFPVMVTDVNNCISLLEDTILVNTFDLPDAVVTPEEITIYEGDRISLTVGEYELYEWYNSEDSLLSILSELNVSKAGAYYVFVTDSNNCTDTSENAIIYTVPLTELYVPNSFTPNGDDHNELFEIYALNVQSFSMIITNRWGELIYQTEDIQKFWDGKFEGRLVPQGDYLYFIELLGEDREKFITQGKINVIY